MPLDKIIFEDKVNNKVSALPAKNKVQDKDMNEIKQKFNALVDALTDSVNKVHRIKYTKSIAANTVVSFPATDPKIIPDMKKLDNLLVKWDDVSIPRKGAAGVQDTDAWYEVISSKQIRILKELVSIGDSYLEFTLFGSLDSGGLNDIAKFADGSLITTQTSAAFSKTESDNRYGNGGVKGLRVVEDVATGRIEFIFEDPNNTSSFKILMTDGKISSLAMDAKGSTFAINSDVNGEFDIVSTGLKINGKKVK